MSLEMEAERQRAGPPPEARGSLRMSTGWEVVFRLVALAVLALAAFAVLWVPFVLLGTVGGVAVIAIIVISLLALAGRMHEIRVRVDALTERLERVEAADAKTDSSPPPSD